MSQDLGKSSTEMQPNMAAALAYLLFFVTGIVFYLIEKENKFVRFHAMQSILAFAACFVLNVILQVIPVVGWALLPVAYLAEVVLWVVLMVKAYQGEKFKLPIVGDMAEKNS